MFSKLAVAILRYKFWVLGVIIAITAFMLYRSLSLEMAYNMQKLVPKDDPEYLYYEKFKDDFGDDGNKVIIGFQNKNLFQKDFFTALNKLCVDFEKIDGVNEALSVANLYNLVKNDSLAKFELKPLFNLDSFYDSKQMEDKMKGIKFYNRLIYNSDSNSALIVVSIKRKELDSKKRISIINDIVSISEKFEKDNNLDFKYSGLPYVRHVFATQVKDELVFFTILSLGITTLLLLLFFRSFVNIIIPIIIVIVAVIWSVGWMSLFGYKITILTGLIPAIMIVIGIPNCVYLINKYHDEIKHHNNKIKALQRVVSRVGIATVLTNTTTAIGFGVFYYTNTIMLEQFGVVAFLSVISIFIISLTLIPILFSFLPSPSVKQTKHLENKWVNKFVNFIHYAVFEKKRAIYFFTLTLLIISFFGFIKLKPLVYMVDDVPEESELKKDLLFIQSHFKGVMPFEIVVDTRTKDGIKELVTLQKINKLQKNLEQDFAEFSKAVSIVEVLSFANQAYHDGEPKYYRLPNSLDLVEIASYFPENENNQKNPLKALVDKDFQKARISIQMADVGSEKMEEIVKEVKEKVDEIFPEEDYEVKITGTSIIFLKGNKYLVNSLGQSILLAFIIISLLMGLLFTSFKMILVSIIPNIIPLLFTAGMMGFLGIPLKPSTILVFSIALGIAVDDTIHFLTKFRSELKHSPNLPIQNIVSYTLKNMGQSMLYTSIILFFGFIIFVFSEFQGTVSLGFLTAITLLIAMLSNLFVLPALILSFEKSINPKEELKESVIEEEED